MTVNKKELLSRGGKVKKFHDFSLPTGGEARMRIPNAGDYRNYRKFLRTPQGDVIPERMAMSDELLVSDLLVDGTGARMFTREEVLTGGMDEILAPDFEKMKEEAYRLCGQYGDAKAIFDEDREKNSSPTAPSE